MTETRKPRTPKAAVDTDQTEALRQLAQMVTFLSANPQWRAADYLIDPNFESDQIKKLLAL